MFIYVFGALCFLIMLCEAFKNMGMRGTVAFLILCLVAFVVDKVCGRIKERK